MVTVTMATNERCERLLFLKGPILKSVFIFKKFLLYTRFVLSLVFMLTTIEIRTCAYFAYFLKVGVSR